MKSPSDFTVYATSKCFTGRYVISPGGFETYRVEIPWAEREEWHDRVVAYLAERGGLIGANACTNFEPNINMTPDGFVVTGKVSFFLLANVKP